MLIITNYTVRNGEFVDSEPMPDEQARNEYFVIVRQARRGFRPFPEVIDENGESIILL